MARDIAGKVNTEIAEAIAFGIEVGSRLRHGYGLILPTLYHEVGSAPGKTVRQRVIDSLFDDFDAGVPVEQATFVAAGIIQRGPQDV